ncbi:MULTISPECIES: restriction endonuclease subunit S [Acinetobacter]|uniref:restriction endonuclease subunit S n=1 Tax=Acinetobacter TaxID=469 RepID=UPI0021CD4C33|nr:MULTISPECIES: restriction endonuclease subunit S [Acinetobacter]MCU4596970.1 restriction endonuclease subunit S [Acinetobacter radioresistens]MDU4033673.1 restriction endonuclease subunit S [Acinetobacter sp.]
MQFKQYPSYKPSGVEWLGDVPEHWNLKRFGYLFDENKKKNIGLKETNVLSLSYGNIKEKNIDDNKGLLPESFETYQIIEPNNIVFRFTDLQNDKRSLRSAISKYHGIITSAYIAVKTKQNADFYNYLFRAYDLQKVFYSMGEGMRQSLKMDELNKMPVVLPNKDEQKRIVSFLDTETTRIDNLITKQEKLIELLEEQRKSIISHAVTKGLNPNAPMKDSGVEWLGEVPEHWDVMRLKNIGKSIIGLTYSPNEICDADDDSYLVLRSSNVQNGQLSFLDNVYVKSSVSEKLKIKKNDILICSRNGSRDLIGKNTIIKNPPKNSTFGAFMTVYRSEYADYVYWILNSYIFKAQAGSYLTTTVNQLTINNLNNMTVPFAPISEQNEIVEFLSTENLKFNNLISKQKSLIEKLKEYRASIISHAVTGKIDVREFGA